MSKAPTSKSPATNSAGKTDFKKLTTNNEKYSAKRIDSPIAKYNTVGQLTCILCNQVVKSELVWNAHINSKSHIETKNKLKSKLANSDEPESNNNSSASDKSLPIGEEAVSISGFKRPAPVLPSTNKELLNKIIQENENDDEAYDEDTQERAKKQKLDHLVDKTDLIDLNKKSTLVDEDTNENVALSSSVLPEGFFDDPELDAKARGISKSENLEAEYEEFKKLMHAEEFKSDVIIEKDDTIRDVDRDIQEVDELITRWSKIESLHQKREQLLTNKLRKKSKADESPVDSDSDDIDINTVINLSIRSKTKI